MSLWRSKYSSQWQLSDESLHWQERESGSVSARTLTPNFSSLPLKALIAFRLFARLTEREDFIKMRASSVDEPLG